MTIVVDVEMRGLIAEEGHHEVEVAVVVHVTPQRAVARSEQVEPDFCGDLLTEISARIPKDLQVTFEELAIDRQVIRIRGHSTSFEAVDRLRTELSAYAPFSQIKVSEITSGRGDKGKSFSVTISMAATEGAT